MSKGNSSDSDLGSAVEDTWVQVAQRHYEPDEHEELTTTIVVALADAMDVDPLELREPTLYEVVDPAALEATLFAADEINPSRNGSGSVEFRYTDYLVTVESDGWVRVYEDPERGG